MNEQDKTTHKGARIETPVRGNPGIRQIWIWHPEKKRYVDPRNISGVNQKHFRAVRRVTVLGKRTRKAATFDTLDDARAWLSLRENAPELSIVRTTKYRLLDLVQEWREGSKPPRLELSTWEMYAKDIFHFKYIEEVPVEELTAEDIDRWLRFLSDPKYPKKESRVSFLREVKTLTTILNWYREYKNPRYQPPILRRHRKDCFFKRKPAREHIALNVEDVERCLARMKMRQKRVYHFLASFQALCGARIGEACGLMWDCVDLERGLVTIRRVCRWHFKTKHPYLEESTKTGEIRVIVIPPRLIDSLKEWKEKSFCGSIVFHKKGQLLSYPAVQNAYKKTFRALGLPVRSTHVFRHSFATIYAQQTKDLRATQAAMGHRDVRVTQHYAKLLEETQRSAVVDFRFGHRKVDSGAPEEKTSVVLRQDGGTVK